MINAEGLLKPDNVYTNNGSSTITITSMDRFDGEQYDIYDSKDYAKMIKDVESICRTSYEYRQLIAFLRSTEGMSVCSFLNNITNVDNTKIKIEIHHSPFTLYDIAETVIKKRLHCKESIDVFDIAKEIMYLHYIGIVGLIPLSQTVHELVHNAYIFIPTNMVRGNYREFVNRYYNFINPDVLDAIDNAEAMTKEWQEDMSQCNNQINDQMAIFNLHSTYVRFKSVDRAAQIPDVRKDIKGRIDQIKSGKKVMYRLIESIEKPIGKQ